MEGVLRFQGRRNYFVLWRTKLYHWKNRPKKRRLSTAWEVYLLSTLENLETDPSQRHVLILKFPQGRIELAANNPGSYQAWLSCFAVFHVRNSLDREAPYIVSSTYMKAIWAVLDHVHCRGCQTRDIFIAKGNEYNVGVLQQDLLLKGPGYVDPQDYRETTVATVVKIFLDALPESLWTEQALSKFRNCDINSNSLCFVIASLPEQNSELLKKLFITLSSVVMNVSKSKVDVEDLTRVITPTLDSRVAPLGLKLEKVTELCIRDYQHLFFGAPLMVVLVPKIEDILTYKRMDFSIKKKKKRNHVRQPHGSYRLESMPKHKEFILTDARRPSGLFQLSSDDESSESQHSLKHISFLRPQFKSEYSPKKSGDAFSSAVILSDLPEVGPIPDVATMSQSILSLASSMDNKIDEKSSDDHDSSLLFQNLSLLLPSKDNYKSSHRARSLSVNLDQNMTGESSDQYSCRNIREVVGRRRAANTRLVKSLATDLFFVYAYLSDDERTFNLDGLFPTRPKRQSSRHRIKVPIAEDEECENYQKDLIEQNKITEFLEVFGPSQISTPKLPSLLKKV